MRKMLMYLIVIAVVFTVCGCDESTQQVYDYKKIETIDLPNYELNYLSESIANENPEYIYSVSVFDDSMNAVSSSNPIIVSDNVNFRVQLNCDSFFDVQFGIVVLSSYIPVEFQVNHCEETYYCYSVTSSKSNTVELQVSLSPILIKGYESLRLMIIENADSASTSLPVEKDFSYALDIPISIVSKEKKYSSDALYREGDSLVYNIHEVFQYDTLSDDDQEFIDTNISAVKNNALNISLSMNESVSLNTKETLITSLSDNNIGWLKCFGQAGRYAAVIFVDNYPVKAFDNKYCLTWNFNDYNKYLNAPFSLPDIEAGTHNIYVLVQPLDMSDKQTVYDSYKSGLLILDELSNTSSIYEEADALFYDEAGNLLNVETDRISYTSGKIYIEFTHSLLRSYISRQYNLYVLFNGVIQDVLFSDNSVQTVSYNLSPSESKTITLCFTPTVPQNMDIKTSDIPIDIIFLPELSNVRNSDLDNTVLFHKRFFVESDKMFLYDQGQNVTRIQTTVSDSQPESTSISLLTPDAPKIEYMFMGKLMRNNSVTMNYKASGLKQGAYVVFALSNGELLKLKDDSIFMSYEIYTPDQTVEISYTLDDDSNKEIKVVFVTVSLESDITRYSPIYYNQTMLVQENFSFKHTGEIQAYRNYDGSYHNLVLFKGTEQFNGYCCSYNYIHRKANESQSKYGYSDYMNSFPISNAEFFPEYFVSASAWIVENIMHIYSPSENGFTVIKYKTPIVS